ncbi:3-isopropylmalate/(R)-2-methylmalate dehydratase small subunit [Desulfotomaculum arcticum]|uniref:3-isopropylmalate/(R)-2-methylmalate dehydratase small subunit n=1 Tax=Desulfotruncus arcticus DSM 17038 TaxID=1121424 RepID=A0A1I2PF83_9FIRM|nr:3-isopropylmalate dehydratase [Desulfotruncus arcticus]SFG14805.1 3-isopropylmalate/(R)-2-methylmalate dehydratase small subunit [Desulfotomaculum arcticum] [Desulfotruncus arcticus DSM 17038]
MSLKTLLQGKTHKFVDDITTDYIIAGKHRSKAENVLDLKDYVFNEIRPGFAGSVTRGDIIVAGHNFGCGSSREHAATLIRACGIDAVLAKSFARIFYRNAINIGLPVIECDTDLIGEGDLLQVDLKSGTVKNLSTGAATSFKPIPASLKVILEAGGLVNHLTRTT